MAIYLGTNELGGGGGGGIGKTVTVGDFNYINAIPLSRWSELGFFYYTSYYPRMIMFRPSSDFTTTYTYNHTSANTYQTIANITGASNGGALHNAQAANSSITGGGTWTFKITIDGGTPVEISTIGMSNRQYTGFILGPHNYSSHGYYSDDYSLAFNGGIGEGPYHAHVYSNSYPLGNSTSSSASYIPYYQNSSSSSGSTSAYGIIKGYRAPLALSYGMPFVHFTSSCKVEFKSSSTNFYSNTIYAAAEISTF